MDTLLDRAGQSRLEAYFDEIGEVLNNKCRRASFALYAMGLLGDGKRKSMEGVAARACADPELVDRVHQRLQQFITDSPWDDRAARLVAARYGVAAMTAGGDPIRHWIVDDTGVVKQGKHSVGVQRQYTGSAGKVTNCQVVVSLTVATVTDHLPIDAQLYLPKSWMDDPVRRKKAHIPESMTFQTKLEQAEAMIGAALDAGIPPGTVLVDSFYGDSSHFRKAVRDRGLHFGVAIHGSSRVWVVDRRGRRRGDPVAVQELAKRWVEARKFRRVTWREGTNKKLSTRFAVTRVVACQDDGTDPATREVLWLVMEWPPGEDGPSKYHLSSLPASLSKRQLIRHLKERYRTERVYQDGKGELGLDHFEGRSFRGVHHHLSAFLCCYAFVLGERVRHFPPSAGRQAATAAYALAA